MINLTEIIDGLFLSGRPKDLERLNAQLQPAKQIKSVVSVGGGKPQLLDALHVGLRDSSKDDFVRHFDRSSDFIQARMEKRTPTLVHCMAGLRRSPTFVAAFLIKYRGYSAIDAEELVRLKRPAIRINEFQRIQLETYENSLAMKQRLHLHDVSVARQSSLSAEFFELDGYIYSFKNPKKLYDLWNSSEELVLPVFSLHQVYYRGRVVQSFRFRFPEGDVLIHGFELNQQLLSKMSSKDLNLRKRVRRVCEALQRYVSNQACVLLQEDKQTCLVVFTGQEQRESTMQRILDEAISLLN